MDWIPVDRAAIAPILDRIPNGHFVLTAAHGDVRCGARVRWVQQCAKSPPMLIVSIEKGQALSAIIRDSHGFAICQVHRDDRVLRRMFPNMPENGVDPFISIPHLRTPAGAPVPLRAMSWFDCEMVRHVDIEADSEIYVGVVHHASIIQPGAAVACHCATEPSCETTGHEGNGSSRAAAANASARLGIPLRGSRVPDLRRPERSDRSERPVAGVAAASERGARRR